jgi:hypothetical protein
VPPTLRALLERVIDYAGLFPPARLPMDEAVPNYLAYRASPQAWLLGGFVCGAAQLADLARALTAHGSAPPDFACCVIGSPLPNLAAAGAALRGDLKQMQQFAAALGIPANDVDRLSLEFRLPQDWTPDSSGIPILFDEINRAATDLEVPLGTVFLEAPLNGPVAEVAQSVNSFLWRTNAVFGLKFRTGGLEPSAYPSPEALARAIAACRDNGLVYKLTAGLHQPLRHEETALRTGAAKTMAHGFLNVLVAAVLASANRRLPPSDILPILEEQSAECFDFSPAKLQWRQHTATLEQIRSARQTALASFGSCSFDEPVEGLRALGWET